MAVVYEGRQQVIRGSLMADPKEILTPKRSVLFIGNRM